jgi:hypothetical protein
MMMPMPRAVNAWTFAIAASIFRDSSNQTNAWVENEGKTFDQ